MTGDIIKLNRKTRPGRGRGRKRGSGRGGGQTTVLKDAPIPRMARGGGRLKARQMQKKQRKTLQSSKKTMTGAMETGRALRNWGTMKGNQLKSRANGTQTLGIKSRLGVRPAGGRAIQGGGRGRAMQGGGRDRAIQVGGRGRRGGSRGRGIARSRAGVSGELTPGGQLKTLRYVRNVYWTDCVKCVFVCPSVCLSVCAVCVCVCVCHECYFVVLES